MNINWVLIKFHHILSCQLDEEVHKNQVTYRTAFDINFDKHPVLP